MFPSRMDEHSSSNRGASRAFYPSLRAGRLDEEFCKTPPLRRRPHARVEIKGRFCDSDV